MTRHPSLPLALLLLALGACSSEAPTACLTGATACFDQPTSVLMCTDGAWSVKACGDGELCHEGSCQTLTCVPRSKSCVGGQAVTCSADGSVWSAPVPCADDEVCHDGTCELRVCDAGDIRCTEAKVERCNPSGTAWVEEATCAQGEACVDGACLPGDCAAGDRKCGSDVAFVCDLGSWKSEACGEGQACAFGACVSCLSDDHCDPGQTCREGACVDSAPEIVTESLSEATVQVSYAATLVVDGGLPPLTFAITDGALPAGIELTTDGRLIGQASQAGSSHFTVEVTDARGATDARAFNLDVLSSGELRITTSSLPTADLDYPYSVELKAAGGVPPYAWQPMQALPPGLSLGSTGVIEGTPTTLGTFPLTIRVLDVRTPPGYAARDFVLTVRIAPLEIIGGEQVLDLFVTKMLTTPLLVPFLPYSTQLEARGGLKPYTWSLETPPSIPFLNIQWGLPSGLSLSSDGRLSGSVNDTSDATTITVPFVNMTLTGYFFYARVTDSQNPAEYKEAIYFVPTVAL